MSASTQHTLKRWRALARDKGFILTCAICDFPIDIDDPTNGLTVDHIIPKSVGGINHRYNYQPAHAKCNNRKGNKHTSPSATKGEEE